MWGVGPAHAPRRWGARPPLGSTRREGGTLLVNDCRSAIIVAENPGKLRTRMNHLPTSAFKVRECVKQALVDLCWAPTDLVAADVLTKNLGPGQASSTASS